MQRRSPHVLLLLLVALALASGLPVAEAGALEAPAAEVAALAQEAGDGNPGGIVPPLPAEEHWWDRTQDDIDSSMASVNGKIAAVLFFDLWFFDNEGDSKGPIDVPFTVAWLVFGAIFFTLKMGFINFRAFGHAIAVVRGKYTDPKETRDGEVSHFQALAAALSATVGLGNIAGVATAITIGGPGATFWMIVAGFLGMSSKMVECSLGQMYKERRSDGSVMGGAMQYLSKGLAEKGLAPLGKVLAVLFTIMCIGGSFGGGNSYQVNQSLEALSAVDGMGWLHDHRWVYGLLMTVAVGVVIIGGIKRIAQVAEKIVPLMCGTYILACLYILLTNLDHVPFAFTEIFAGAFTGEGVTGGVIGVMVVGFKRAAFSNEAGIGSAAIAHSAAKTDQPVREGIVALLEPFIDTVVVCTMTALVIVITDAYENPAFVTPDGVRLTGASLTSAAMRAEISWFPYVLGVATMLFAYSTMISWSYYGERSWMWLFGDKSSLVYKCLFLVFTFLGSIVTATQVLDFGDLMILGMALPNVLGVLLLSGKVRRSLDEYMARLRKGEFKTYS
jgi:AGCS family alanine or glycine:cation symporter